MVKVNLFRIFIVLIFLIKNIIFLKILLYFILEYWFILEIWLINYFVIYVVYMIIIYFDCNISVFNIDFLLKDICYFDW